MKARLTQRASNDIERVTKWWLANTGGSPAELFDELEATLRLLERMPEAGNEYASSYGRPVYRILLRNSQFHVYYRLEPGVVRVVTIRSVRRERGPRFYAG